MPDLMDRLKAFQKEGSEKFAALSQAGNAVRCFAEQKRENSADNYDIDRITSAVDATVKASVCQSAKVYEEFGKSKNKI